MRLVADSGKKRSRATRSHVLVDAQMPAVAQGFQAVRVQARVSQPQDHVQVAQAAGALFHVRLQQTDAVAVLRVARLGLRAQRRDELLRLAATAEHGLVQTPLEDAEERLAAHQPPRLGHRGARVQVCARDGDALLDRSEAVAHSEARVPQQRQGALHEPTHHIARVSVVQEQYVDVRERRQLASSVSAERHQGHRVQLALDRGRELAGHQLADALDHQVDLLAATGSDLVTAQPDAVPHAQPLCLEP